MCLSHVKKYPASKSSTGRRMVALVHLCICNTILGTQQMYDQYLLDERMNETSMPMVHTCNETFIKKNKQKKQTTELSYYADGSVVDVPSFHLLL